MRRAVAFVLPMVLLVPGAVRARRVAPTPISIQIEGYMGSMPEGVALQTSWAVTIGNQLYHLRVATLRVLRGDIAYFNIISALEPYKVALQIYGRDEALNALTGAQPGQKLLISGSLRLAGGPGTLLLDSVRPLDTSGEKSEPG